MSKSRKELGVIIITNTGTNAGSVGKEGMPSRRRGRRLQVETRARTCGNVATTSLEERSLFKSATKIENIVEDPAGR